MAGYVLKRIGYSLLTILVLVALTFFMMQLLPGDPFIGAKAIDESTKAMLMAKSGVYTPVWQQLILFVVTLFLGVWGVTKQYTRPVVDIIAESFPYSFELGIRALIFAAVMGVLLGIVAAVKRGTAWDTGSMLIAMVGVSVPSFIVGALLQYFFSVKLFQWTGMRLFPVTGWTTEMSKLLPAFALSFGTLASISRLMRSSTLDVLSSDYVKTAKAKGLSQAKIIWRHVVRNAIMPIVTVLGPQAAAILTGAFVVEKIFGIPGMGRFFVNSINSRDYTLIAGTTLFYGAFLVLANLVVDLLYGVIDPRIRLSGRKE